MGNAVNKAAKRIKKEWAIRGYLRAGYPRKTASRWYNMCRRDSRLWRNAYPKSTLDAVHAQGYLAKNIERLSVRPGAPCERITDLDYLFLQPFNNSYAKWLGDLNTMNRMLPAFSAYIPKVYFSVFNRQGLHILSYPSAETKKRTKDILRTLAREKVLLLRPAFFGSTGRQYVLTYASQNELWVGKRRRTIPQFKAMLSKLGPSYVVCERVRYDYPIGDDWEGSSYFKLYVANDMDEGTKLLFGIADVFDDFGTDRQVALDIRDGSFQYNDCEYMVPHWDLISETILRLAGTVRQISYFSVSVVAAESGFKICNCSTSPVLPRIMPNKELNDYLLGRVRDKKSVGQTTKQKADAIRYSLYRRHVKKKGKKGIRPYMQKLWEEAVKADKKWPGTTMAQKKWAWERGFLSFRISQYGLTEENYKNYLSDYQYHWLNRINGVYQGWVNDKLTFRYIMEPFKKYVPDYYFSVFKNRGETVVARLMDCPDGFQSTMDSICALLRQEKKLAFKAAAGTHGDGFYALEYVPETGTYQINGQESTQEELEALLASQRSFYVVTSYINMHPTLKRIYPQSVNSIRIMVINRNGYAPKIMQTYMRIGSSKTGYTDNVGYGGICAMVDTETGTLYAPETLRDHVYYPCPVHPDTGVEIAGIQIPHWREVCEAVLEICRSIPELEYLGFDVAVTEDGFNVMEINIHQDLHKVAQYSDEIMEFFRSKIRYKERQNGLPYSV